MGNPLDKERVEQLKMMGSIIQDCLIKAKIGETDKRKISIYLEEMM